MRRPGLRKNAACPTRVYREERVWFSGRESWVSGERVLLGGVVVGGGSGGGVVGVAAFFFNMSGVGAREFALGIEPMFVVRAIRAAGGLPHLIGATGDLFVGRISRHGARGGWIRRCRSRPRAGPTKNAHGFLTRGRGRGIAGNPSAEVSG